jgi:type VI secretion system protein ImpE
VRNEPSVARHRILIFQLLSVLGEWSRAVTQLDVLGGLDAGTLGLAQSYGAALRCEALRTAIFAGEKAPVVFGDPEQWMALLIEALRLGAQGRHAEAQDLRKAAFDAAPPSPGTIDGEAFEWIADGDTRLGPMLEVILDGRYCWMPFQRIREIRIEKPTDLRDTVWTSARFTWTNGGESAGLIPTRYPGSERSEDTAIRLARRTGGEAAPVCTTAWASGCSRRRERLWMCGIVGAVGPRPAGEVGAWPGTRRDPGWGGCPHMADQDRLQPSLLDRLTDEEPQAAQEARDKRVMSFRRLREAVIRDLGWLLNTAPLDSVVDLEAFPQVAQSVLNFGLLPLAGRTVSGIDVQGLERLLRQTISTYEPRILKNSLKVRVVVTEDQMNHNALAFRIEGELWAQPTPMRLLLQGDIDLENGKVAISEGGGRGTF